MLFPETREIPEVCWAGKTSVCFQAFPFMMMDWVYSSVPLPRDPPSLFDVLDQVVFFSTSLVPCGSEDVCSLLTFGSVLRVA